jgi:hypothetical protein
MAQFGFQYFYVRNWGCEGAGQISSCFTWVQSMLQGRRVLIAFVHNLFFALVSHASSGNHGFIDLEIMTYSLE